MTNDIHKRGSVSHCIVSSPFTCRCAVECYVIWIPVIYVLLIWSNSSVSLSQCEPIANRLSAYQQRIKSCPQVVRTLAKMNACTLDIFVSGYITVSKANYESHFVVCKKTECICQMGIAVSMCLCNIWQMIILNHQEHLDYPIIAFRKAIIITLQLIYINILHRTYISVPQIFILLGLNSYMNVTNRFIQYGSVCISHCVPLWCEGKTNKSLLLAKAPCR